MRRKTFAIPAGPLARQALAEAISAFTEAAYPPGGSDCAQVARETLLTTAGQIRQADGPAAASVRQRPLLKQAVQWYCCEFPGRCSESHEAALLALLRSEPVNDALFS